MLTVEKFWCRHYHTHILCNWTDNLLWFKCIDIQVTLASDYHFKQCSICIALWTKTVCNDKFLLHLNYHLKRIYSVQMYALFIINRFSPIFPFHPRLHFLWSHKIFCFSPPICVHFSQNRQTSKHCWVWKSLSKKCSYFGKSWVTIVHADMKMVYFSERLAYNFQKEKNCQLHLLEKLI
jgi:hypothetical protein